jgi:hypothetical protein
VERSKYLEYCQKLITIIENIEHISNYPAVREKLNMLKELVEDDLEQLALMSQDADAKIPPFFVKCKPC